jgi:PAS domain S-box-containing protein
MTAVGLAGWDDAASKPATWRIEKEVVRTQTAYFFPDQQGGVYERMISSLPIALHCMDGSGRLISANRHWCDTFGYQLHEVLGRSFSEFLPVESRSKLVTTIYPKYLTTSMCRSEEILILRKDGSLATVLLSMTAYRGEKGRLDRSVCMMEDITEKKIAALATNRSDQRFRAAFSASVHAMIVISPTGQIEFANDAFKDMLERKDVEAATYGFDELLHKDDRGQFLNGLRQLLSGEASNFQLELRYLCPNGKIVNASTSVALVKNENGGTEQLVIQMVDTTERKSINDRLQRAQKMEAVGQLTGGLAHDFNNLLTIIMGNLQLLDGKLNADEKATKRLAEAQDAARKGSDLTRQLLAFARKQDLEPRDTSINVLVEGMESLVARTIGENIELKFSKMAGDPRSLIDPSQLESAILNLAINGRDAMPNGGKLTIETQPAYLDRYYAEKNPEVVPGHYVLVAVSDSGTGMAPEVLEKVFQPFFTTKPAGKGTGLGLAMVYGFIKQSGGHIQIYSEVGHGTSIKMYLPRRMRVGEVDVETTQAKAEAPAARVVSTPAAAVANLVTIVKDVPPVEVRKQKILVVEDQEAVRAVACGFLEDFGYEIIEAGDGFEALSKLQEYDDIDLMFSDVVMPGGMNGFDLAQAALSMKPGLKVVHTSGYPKGAMVHQDEPRFKEGFIIMKPYRREDLQKIIKDALERQ